MSRIPPSAPARLLGATALGALLLAAAACAPVEDEPAADAGATECTPEGMETLTAGTLTIGTDSPAYPPWFVDDDPTNGEGYESAVAYAVAEELGYSEADVVWESVTFNNAIQPGPKAFDVDINQFTITDERKQAVDFSSPYYDVRQTVITVAGSAISEASSIADLKDATLGAQVGTTSLDALTEVIAPTADPQVFNNNDDAKKALENGQVDGIVVDLPTAFYITGAELDDGVIIGQLPAQQEAAEQFGLVLDKGSALTPCVSQAIDSLVEQGVIAELEQQWLADVAEAPELS
ncbi:ABC transporter substrate-binding protein [Nocardiopsis ansamitocini]|uniref:Amino acid ABC transporter substrate-binding protein n=1 Tax=Nocardiopsis ansamitocini TaxID=1670832 RepID=A0A9W6P5Q6_9ACTN|nr:ABC transporter substrate-binding protein [Nocardiopsis ansamitocini]GLU47685.1 amino acid ABC transporter substrate-binding protein [Nocardiopsis ansamitocini]